MIAFVEFFLEDWSSLEVCIGSGGWLADQPPETNQLVVALCCGLSQSWGGLSPSLCSTHCPASNDPSARVERRVVLFKGGVMRGAGGPLRAPVCGCV
jgi:hypothetical protein